MLETWPAPQALALLLAFAIDRLAGELPNALHPVAWMGHAIGWARRSLPTRPAVTATAAGAVVALLLPTLAALVGLVVLRVLSAHPTAQLLFEALLLSTAFAVRALGQAMRAVAEPLSVGQLDAARAGLSALCSRDPSALSPTELSAATIESGAENASDSFVAPLFYYVLLGLPGALAYRAINTLDAMLGYRGQLEYLGWASARLDDLANLVPARLTACLLWLSGLLRSARGETRMARARRGLAVWWRDAGQTPSPNGGHPMAMMAGLLGVTLDKPGGYVLGAELQPATPDDATRAFALIDTTAWQALVLAVAACMLRAQP